MDSPRSSLKSGGVLVVQKPEGEETSGYLLKFSKSASAETNGWKKRFFVLRGSTLNYFSDQSSTKSKGELLIFAETQIKSANENGQAFCISLWEPFSLLQLATASAADMAIWVQAFTRAIETGRRALRSIMYRKAQLADGGTKKKFFILHSDVITYHKDREQLLNVQGLVHLDRNTDMEYNDAKMLITVQDMSANYGLSIQFKTSTAPEQGVYSEWKAALQAMLRKYNVSTRNAETSSAIMSKERGAVLLEGPLQMKLPHPADGWIEYMFYLTESELVVVNHAAAENEKIVDTLRITSNSCVFETNLGPHAFELVTPTKVLHAMPRSDPSLAPQWIAAIKGVIGRAYLDTNDPLLQSAILQIDDDEFLTITITEKKPLGITFERANEWAIVKSTKGEGGIPIGAALSQINDKSCILAPYNGTIELLKSWMPPLTLRFRLPPGKFGYLLKESRSKRDPSRTVWKKRFFILGSGRLCYKETADPESTIKGEFPLLGSVVSLVSAQEIGRFFCLRLISGVAVLLLQSATERQMLEWASTLYHAIAIANGGGHILNYERDRLLLSEGDMTDIGDRDDVILSAQEALLQAKSRSLSSSSDAMVQSPQFAEATESLRAAMANARYDHLFTLVESIEFAKRSGVDAAPAAALLAELQLRKRSAEGSMARVTAAGTSRDRDALVQAIAEAESIGLTRELDPARALLAQLALGEAEEVLLKATQLATVESIAELAAAIERAKASHVGVARIVDAQAVAITLRKRRAELDECIANLHAATQARSAARIESTLLAASHLGLENHIAALMADQVLAQIKQEGLERELDEAVRAATCVDVAHLQRAIARAEAECDPDYPIAPHLLAQAQSRLGMLLELQALRLSLLGRLAQAVDVEVADQIDEVLTAIDATEEVNEQRAMLADEPHVVAAREMLLKLREDERLVVFWREAEEKARAEEVIKARLAQEELLERERAISDTKSKVDHLVQELLKASADSNIHNVAVLQDCIARLSALLLSAVPLRSSSGGPATSLALSEAIDITAASAALSEGQALADILASEKEQHDACATALQRALQAMTIPALTAALAEADSKCEHFGFTLGDEHNTARYELSRLRREEAEAQERARQLEREERLRKTAAEAAKRALLDEEERLRLEMEEKERVDKEIAEKVAAAEECLEISILAAAKSSGVSPAARSIESHDASIRSLEEALAQGQQAQQTADEGRTEAPGLAAAMTRGVQALAQHKQDRATFRIHLASSSATIDDYTFLDSVLGPENAADRALVEPEGFSRAMNRLSELKSQRQARAQAQQMLNEAMESGSLALLERSLQYSEEAGYATLTAAVAASSMLAGMKKTALEEEIDAAMAASTVGDFLQLEGLLARVDEQKSLGVDAGKVLLMKQKLRELSQRRKEQIDCTAALRAFLEVHEVFTHSTQGPAPEVIPEEHLAPLNASMAQLQGLLSQADALGLGAVSAGESSEAEESRAAVEAGRSMMHVLRCIEATSLLQHCIIATCEVSGVEQLVRLLEQGQRLKIAPSLLLQGNALLDALVSVKILRKNVIEGLERAVNTAEPSIAALEAALEQLHLALNPARSDEAGEPDTPAAQSIARISSAAALTEDVVPAIRQARMLLSTLKTKRASEALATALGVSTVEECETLEQALELSQGVLGQDDALYASALERLTRLRELRQTRHVAARAVEAAIGNGGIEELEAAIALAAACGLEGDFIDGAKSLLFMLNQVAADADLAAAMEAAVPEDTSALEAAILRAEKVSLDEYKVTHAAELLARMRHDKAARVEAVALLRDTMEAPVQTLAALEAALDAASALQNKAALPPLLLELVEVARERVKTIKATKERERILKDVKDAMRLKNSAIIRKNVDVALASGVPPSDAVLVQAEAALTTLHERAQQEQEQEQRDDEARRQRAVDSELARQAAAAQAAADKLKQPALQPDSAKDRVSGVAFEEEDDDDDEGDGDLAEEREQESSLPRKLARRKSKRYSFSHTAKASREELHKVFINYGGAGGPARAGSNSDPSGKVLPADDDEAEEGGFINAMQFSNIWRLITEEKGNLFKEMQMFKKFDRSGEGVLREDDFIDGWSKLAEEGAGGYSGEHLLTRISALANPLPAIGAGEDDDEEEEV